MFVAVTVKSYLGLLHAALKLDVFEGFGCTPAWNMDCFGEAENLAALM